MPSIINAATSGGLISTADTSGELQLQTASTTALTVNSSQNVGIGITPSSARLTVHNASSTGEIGRFSSAQGTGEIQLNLGFTTTNQLSMFYDMGTGNGGLSTNVGSADLIFRTVSTERMRIVSGGYVYIGRTSDTDAAGITLGNDGFIRANRNGGTAMVANRNTNNGTLISFRQAGNTVGTVDVTTTGTTYTGTNGVTFTATQTASADANTLDDYEEGTWTPSIGGTATYTAQTGTYTKIGRFVSVNAILTINLRGTGSQTRISGLPYAVAINGQGGIGYFGSIATSLVFIQPYCDTNSDTSVNFRTLTAGATSMGDANIFQNGTRIDFTVTYFTS
jgi:hypothetical protein